MQKLSFTHCSTLDLDESVSDHRFTLRILPCDDPAQTIHIESASVEPCDRFVIQEDGWGNALYVGECVKPHDYFKYRVSGTAVVDSAKGRGSSCNEAYRFPSFLTQPGPSIKALHENATRYQPTGNPREAFDRAIELRALVFDFMNYVPDVTNVETRAEKAACMRQGVCQDYAHILCALLRLDGIASRYVCGMMIGEGATHAWVEFFDGSTWWGEDPTNNCEAGDFYIALARGRDRDDCAMERGVFRGGAMQRQLTHVDVQAQQ